MTRAAWTDFDQLIADLSQWVDNEPNHTKARLIVRAIAYMYWQKSVMEELKSENATLEATARS